MHANEQEKWKLEDTFRETDQIHRDEIRRLNEEISRLNDRNNVMASDSLKHAQQLNDKIKELLKNNIRLTETNTRMELQSSVDIRHLQQAQQEHSEGISQRDKKLAERIKEISSLEQKIEVMHSQYTAAAKNYVMLQNEIKHVNDQHKAEVQEIKQQFKLQQQEKNEDFEKSRKQMVEENQKKQKDLES